MSTTLHSFMDIFETTIEDGDTSVQLTDTVTISQNEAGIDTEDRIIKLKKYIANMK